MFNKKILSLAVTAILASSFSVSANSNLDISGFASFKASSTLGSDEKVYSFTDELNFKDESLFAIQVKSELSDKISVTAQLLSRGEEDYDVNFEWAYLTYKLSDKTTVNVGRLRAPFYKYSDFMDVGYAYNWLRVPQSVYSMGYDNIDGFSVIHNTSIKNWYAAIQFTYGKHESDITVGGLPTYTAVDNIYGASITLENDPFSIRLAHFRGKLDLTNDSLNTLGTTIAGSGLVSMLPELNDFAIIQDNQATFSGIGFTYDNMDWVFETELTRAEIEDSWIPVQKAMYVSLGKRFSDNLVFVSYEKQKNENNYDELTSTLATSPAAMLGGFISQVIAGGQEVNDTYSIGYKKEITPSVSFKTQYSYFENKTQDTDSNLVSVGFDVVF